GERALRRRDLVRDRPRHGAAATRGLPPGDRGLLPRPALTRPPSGTRPHGEATAGARSPGERALSASCVQRGQRTGDPWACGVAMPSAVVYLARASLPIAG